MERQGYHHSALIALDLEQTIQFYEALGCSVIRIWGEGERKGCMMDIGGGDVLEIFPRGKEGQDFDHCPLEHFALRSEDVQADVDNALAHGAVLYRDVKETNLGGDYPIRIAFVVGPNGELIEFFKEL